MIKNYWVFNMRSISHFRSWLVVKVFSQVEDINFDELLSLVIYYEIICLFLAIITPEDSNIDIKTLYLYSNLDEKIYIK